MIRGAGVGRGISVPLRLCGDLGVPDITTRAGPGFRQAHQPRVRLVDLARVEPAVGVVVLRQRRHDVRERIVAPDLGLGGRAALAFLQPFDAHPAAGAAHVFAVQPDVEVGGFPVAPADVADGAAEPLGDLGLGIVVGHQPGGQLPVITLAAAGGTQPATRFGDPAVQALRFPQVAFYLAPRHAEDAGDLVHGVAAGEQHGRPLPVGVVPARLHPFVGRNEPGLQSAFGRKKSCPPRLRRRGASFGRNRGFGRCHRGNRRPYTSPYSSQSRTRNRASGGQLSRRAQILSVRRDDSIGRHDTSSKTQWRFRSRSAERRR